MNVRESKRHILQFCAEMKKKYFCLLSNAKYTNVLPLTYCSCWLRSNISFRLHQTGRVSSSSFHHNFKTKGLGTIFLKTLPAQAVSSPMSPSLLEMRNLN